MENDSENFKCDAQPRSHERNSQNSSRLLFWTQNSFFLRMDSHTADPFLVYMELFFVPSLVPLPLCSYNSNKKIELCSKYSRLSPMNKSTMFQSFTSRFRPFVALSKEFGGWGSWPLACEPWRKVPRWTTFRLPPEWVEWQHSWDCGIDFRLKYNFIYLLQFALTYTPFRFICGREITHYAFTLYPFRSEDFEEICK